nr:hypothetical protein [Streptomyces viridochromogenes]
MSDEIDRLIARSIGAKLVIRSSYVRSEKANWRLRVNLANNPGYIPGAKHDVFSNGVVANEEGVRSLPVVVAPDQILHMCPSLERVPTKAVNEDDGMVCLRSFGEHPV